MFRFDDPAQVVATLQRLASRTEEEHPEGPLVVQLARQPGSREARWAHLLAGPVEPGTVVQGPGPRVQGPENAGLLEQVEELRREIRELKERLDRLEGRA
jgi:hypothetical protein